MKYTLSNKCLQTILNISKDVYIVVEHTTLKLLDWNVPFEKSVLSENMGDYKDIYLDKQPYSECFSGLNEVIKIQEQLLQQGHDPNNLLQLPLKTEESLPYNISARVVHILEDNDAVLMQICINKKVDIQSQENIENLEKREILLKATSKVAQELLTETDNFDITIDAVLGILGNATSVDRVYVWSIHNAPNPEEDDRLYTSQLYEWSEGAEPQQGNDLVTNMLVEEGIPTWIDTFLAGRCVNNLVKNMHEGEREVLEPQGIISILTAPIMFHGHLWGFIGFDNCHSEYTWSRAEEDILRTAGTLISTAIHSRRTNEALYAAQERFRGVEEATGDIVWSVDANHNIDYISNRLKTVLQYNPEEIIGKPFNALLLNPDEFKCTATPENFIMREFELRALCKDGSVKWLSSSCKYSFDADGNILYGFGSSSDVTLMHEARDALHIANKELEEAIKIANELVESANKANAIKGNFIANMSHEIRTPMNAVVGITHLLKHTDLSPKQWEYINQIDESSATLLTIINDILDFSKIQDGDMVIEKHSFAIKNIIEEVKKTAAQWIDEKNIEFTINIAPEVAASYIGDAVRLNQILTSLTTNAIKFTPTGSIHIDAHIESSNEESELIHFSVQDTGIGIEKNKINLLFQDFTQADISSTRRYGGIGLGLALCKNLAALMGGELWCTSEIGKGSTFNFTCRLEKDISKASQANKQLEELNIIVAFPDETSFKSLQQTLNPLGYAHLFFANNIMAINEHILSANGANIIILHEDFAELSIMHKVLANQNDYFSNIPILYFGKEQNIEIPKNYTIIKSLDPSSLHDSFVNILGPVFNPAIETFKQGFEDILRTEHGGKKILLVEDNEINQMIAQSILEDVGLVVTVANNGLEGYEQMYKDDFDLVIMDIQMPVMDGLSATKKIRSDSKFDHIPIIAMTAHAMKEDKEKSLNAGMNDHTTKPINAGQLFKTILLWLTKDK